MCFPPMDARRTIIAHISDLHFGAASPSAVQALAEDLKRCEADLTVITGDITQEGRKSEFAEALEFLRGLSGPILIVPGNHDLPVRNLWARFLNPYKRFTHNTGFDLDPVFSNDKVTVAGLNSARRAAIDINWSYGRLSNRQIDRTAVLLKKAPSNSLKAIALHHPLTPGPGRAGARIVGRGKDALEKLTAYGLDIAFTGHVHHSDAKVISVADKGLIIVQAGTATSIRTRGEEPAYNIIKAAQNRIDVSTLELHQGRFVERREAAFAYHDLYGWRVAGENNSFGVHKWAT